MQGSPGKGMGYQVSDRGLCWEPEPSTEDREKGGIKDSGRQNPKDLGVGDEGTEDCT